MSGDTYARIEIAPGLYQCGCYWTRQIGYGNVLKQCSLHQQHTNSSVDKFERERKAKKNK